MVGFAAGGIADLGARLLADHITRETGQTVVVENRPAAAGTVAVQAVAKAPPDGYTLGVVLSGQLVINPFVQKAFPLDTAQGRPAGGGDRRGAADDRDQCRRAGEDAEGVRRARQGQAATP